MNTITGATATLPDVSNIFPRIPSRRAISRAFRPMTQIAAAAAIILAVAAGMFVYANGVPEGGLNSFVPGALPSSQENRCTLTPPSDEQLSRILGVNSILLGSSAEITRWIEPAVRVDLSIDLPNSSAADQSTIDRVNETWNEFRACSNVENRTASFAVMSEDGVRRVFFRNIYSDVIAMAIPMSHMTGEKATSMEVNPAATPATVSGWTEPDETTLTLGETRLLDDGRVISALVDPATPGQTELAGYAVFVNVNGTWLIDDFIVSKG